MAVLPRREVLDLEVEQHGGPGYLPEGPSARPVVDFSVSVNPYGLAPAVAEAIARAEPARYPDPHAWALREAIAGLHGLTSRHVLVVNGTAQAIWLLALAFLSPGDTALVVAPTFGEYRVASQLMGVRVAFWRSQEENGFVPDADAIASRILRSRPRLVWLCNPNNPTGTYLGRPQVEVILEACVCAGSLLALDEAYVKFVESPWDSAPLLESGHVAVLRSMTKDFALAGLRLGYVVADPSVVRALGKVQPPWSVNSLAQEAGLAALHSLDHYRRTWAALRRVSEEFRRDLRELGLKVLPSATNFCLVQVGSARQVKERLLSEGILVRDCSSFGLPEYIRVGTKLPRQNRLLVEALSRHIPIEEVKR